MNGAVVGVVQDSSGGVVPDTAWTSFRNVTTDQTVGTTVSGADGAATHSAICLPAKYEVQALKPGFQLVTLSMSRSCSDRRSSWM